MKRDDQNREQWYQKSAELRVERDEADGKAKIVGYAAVFNVLSPNHEGFRELIAPGAFSEAVKEDDVRALWNHDSNHVLGRTKSGTLRLEEDERGLRFEVDPPDTPEMRAKMISIERGDVDQASFAFRLRDAEGEAWHQDDDGLTVRTLKRLRLFDVSPGVAFPYYPQTSVAVRSRFESFLQESKIKDAPTFESLEEREHRQKVVEIKIL